MNKFINFLKNNKNDILKPVVVLLSICVVIPLALSLTNELTAEKIQKLQSEKEKSSMSQLIDADIFGKLSFQSKEEEINFHVALTGGKPQGYIFVTSAKGYGGDVSVMTAVGLDGKIIGVSILDAANETPGLGQNITKESFYSQFKDMQKGIGVIKSGLSTKDNEINAVTGASISSRAVRDAVDKALTYFEEYTSSIPSVTEVVYIEE